MAHWPNPVLETAWIESRWEPHSRVCRMDDLNSMSREFPALGLILLFPAIGVVFNVFFGRRAGRVATNFVAPALIFLAFGASLAAFAVLLTMPRGAALTLFL